MSKANTATFIRHIKGWTGDARLYRLSEPLIKKSEYDGDAEEKYDYVVVSAVVAMFSGPETYIFGSDKEGEVESYHELKGSLRGKLDHTVALAGAGYLLA